MNLKIFLPVVAVLLLAFLLVRCSSKRPVNIGLIDGGLHKCPSTPNCVSSRSADTAHRIDPLTFSVSPEAARVGLASLLGSMSRAKVVEQHGAYIRAEFTSALFRFVDDVEFLFDDGAKVIHVRSASRTGRSDFGVNRKRLEDIRTRFASGAGAE